MPPDIALRDVRADDRAEVEALYAEAFPNEDLMPLVRDLADEPAAHAFVAERDGRVIAHAILTECRRTDDVAKVALLGPLAVAAEHQRRGVGRSLIDHGLEALARRGITLVCVLGDPAYYARLGFVPELSVLPPYELPAAWSDAWQSRRIGSGDESVAGELAVPPPWQRPELWSE